MKIYEDNIRELREILTHVKRQYNQVSILRLLFALLALVNVYFLLSGAFLWMELVVLSILLAGFIYLINRHQKIKKSRRYNENLLAVNEHELQFLNNEFKFDGGEVYIDIQHHYSYDLDLFGQNSLYQFLNRSTTHLGAKQLANALLVLQKKEEIILRQDAIRELTPLLPFRQQVQAWSMMQDDHKDAVDFIEKWSGVRSEVTLVTKVLSWILPLIFIMILAYLVLTKESVYFNILTFLFFANLGLLGANYRKIKNELSEVEHISKVFEKYGNALSRIEGQNFNSSLMSSLTSSLEVDGSTASKALHRLSYLMGQLDTLHNGMVVILFSGTWCFHLHTLQKIYKWKREYAAHLPQWLTAIGDFEMLSGLANYAYNNSDFTYPIIADIPTVQFEDLGHPLISREERVGNDISFEDHRYVILTGSNMSGKSTFLRSLGVAMVLARAGAPVCAKSATLYPMDVLVSMRIADSLADSQSYFYAEVKRLKHLSDQFEKGTTLVLLDEILRGTNSDDKRNGTIEMIRRMVGDGVYGMIATHDLQVCEESNNSPQILTNKCFEVEIDNNELYFDYKLRSGICVNQSATFLMKKMNII